MSFGWLGHIFGGPPQMWVWPQLLFGGSPPHPPLQLEDPSLKPKPFPPRPLPPSSPHPLALFAMPRDGAAQSGVGGGVLGCRGGRGGGPSSGTWGQTHIWGRSIFYRNEKSVHYHHRKKFSWRNFIALKINFPRRW